MSFPVSPPARFPHTAAAHGLWTHTHITGSGSIPCDDAELHVVLAATHCFDRTLLDTVVVDNVNPIDKAERSMLILASLIHGRPAEELVVREQQ